MKVPRVETIGNATLYLGDCREILPTLGKVDAVVADPPYGQNFKPVSVAGTAARNRGLNGGWVMKQRNHGGTVRGDDEDFDPTPFIALADHVLLWGAHVFGSRLPPGGRLLVWDKRVDLPTITLGDGEIAWVSTPGALRIFRHQWSGLVIKAGTEEAERQPGTSAAKPRLHPTQKPVQLMQWCLEFIPAKCATILDPFMGSGTTGVACAKVGRAFIGIEIEPEYFDIACHRIEEAYSQPDFFVDTRESGMAGRQSDFLRTVTAEDPHSVTAQNKFNPPSAGDVKA
jgi:site-specific DNA-methyltransferase (adenine-specific)